MEKMEGKPRTILCIEDERKMVDLFRLILERYDYHIVGAFDGEQGLRLAEETQPDLVLLDLMMPGMGGWSVYQELRSRDALQDVPVIVVTAKAQTPEQIHSMREAGIDACISKPFKPQTLVDAVNDAVEKRSS